MRTKLPFFLSLALLGLVLTNVSPVRAETASNTLTDAQLVAIRSNCGQLKTQLDRIHSSDALLRVNRGQLYEHMGTRLMTPLNTRIAANRLDGAQLIGITSDYETHLDAFRMAYRDYERKLSATLRIDCQKQPAAFYDSLAESRTLRTKVFEATELLRQDVSEYSKEFDVFATAQKGDS